MLHVTFGIRNIMLHVTFVARNIMLHDTSGIRNIMLHDTLGGIILLHDKTQCYMVHWVYKT